MKIFGKRRKRSSTDSATLKDTESGTASTKGGEETDILLHNHEIDPVVSTQQTGVGVGEEEVRSYFSPDFFSNKNSASASKPKNSHDIQEILAMDPKTLTSKQRRLIRRHEERTGSSSTTKDHTVLTNDEKNVRVKVDKDGSKHCNANMEANSEGKETNEKNKDKENKEQERSKRKSVELLSIASTASSTTNEEEFPKPVEKDVDNLKQRHQKQPAIKDNRFVATTISGDSINKDEVEMKPNKKNAQLSGAVSSVETKISSSSNSTSVKIEPSSDNVIDQLKNLNSKERRKLLRKLASESKTATSTADSTKEGNISRHSDGIHNNCTTVTPNANDAATAKLIVLAAEESNRIAEQNRMMEKEKVETHKKEKNKKRKRDGIEEPVPDNKDAKITESKPKKKKMKDLSHLPPEERARRDEQRRMQQEAAERRKAGEMSTRHPLNSERRRANRRKPGRAGKIAILKRETKVKLEGMRSYNAGGYMMRHHSKDHP